MNRTVTTLYTTDNRIHALYRLIRVFQLSKRDGVENLQITKY